MFEIEPVAIFVPPLPPVGRWRLFARGIALLARVTGYALVLGLRYLVDRVRRGRPQAQVRLARRVVRRVERLGATYVKFGQMLASRPDLLAPHVVAELARLLDEVTPMTAAELDAQWRRAVARQPALGSLVFTGRCLGSGSIACVYEAAESADVAAPLLAVKVQRPGIAARMATDLTLVTAVTRLAEKFP